MKNLIALLILTSCGAKTVEPKTLSKNEELQARYEEKVRQAKEVFDHDTGWPSATDCDGTLWAGLAYAAGIDTVRLQLAEYSEGEIHRRPSPPCWDGEDRGSATTVSRDMLNGYMWGMWRARNLDALRRLAGYGEAHFWKMGRPLDDGRTILTGNGIGLLGRMIKKLDGPDKIYRHIQPVFTKVSADYERHGLALGILLEGEVDQPVEPELLPRAYEYPGRYSDITENQSDLLEWLAAESPGDALFQAGHATYSGDYNKAVELLLDQNYKCPSYVRGSDNYCLVHWLFAAKLVLIRVQ